MATTKDLETLRIYADNMRKGGTPGPKALKWMQDVAGQAGLDFETLVSGTRGGAAAGGVAAGASFGFGDELRGAGAAMVPGGAGYDEARDKSRSVAKAQRFMNPVAYTGAEVGTGVAASFVPVAGWMGRGAQAGRLATAGRAAAAGAAQGGLNAYGNQEGSNNPLTGQTIAGTALGGAGGLVGGFLAGAANRGPAVGRAARTELARIMDEHGIDAETAIRRMATGEGGVTTNNQTLLMEARAAFDQAGAGAKREILQEVQARAKAGRGEIVDEMAQSVPAHMRVGNAQTAFDEAVAVPNQAERYAAAHAAANQRIAGRGVPQNLMQDIDDLSAMGSPEELANLINRNSQAAIIRDARNAGQRPGPWSPVVEVQDGRLVFLREPQIMELEQINRSVRDAVTGMYGRSSGSVPSTARETMSQTQQDFRRGLGAEYEDWGRITSEIAASRNASDGFRVAQNAVGSPKSSAALMQAWPEMTDEARDGARAAILAQVRDRMATAPTGNPVRGLAPNPVGLDPHMVEVLRVAFPGEDLERIIRRASGRQELNTALTQGSQTSSLQTAKGRYGGGPSVADYALPIAADAAVSGGAFTAAKAGADAGTALIKRMGIGDRQAAVIARALATENPEVFRAALRGDPDAVSRIGQMVQALGISAGSQGAETGGLAIFDQ